LTATHHSEDSEGVSDLPACEPIAVTARKIREILIACVRKVEALRVRKKVRSD
jgi:hypothetical protein